MRDRLQVALISSVRFNPYVRLLREGLLANEPNLHCMLSDRLTLTWLLPRLKRLNVLHIHWAELLYQAPQPWQRSLRFWQMQTALHLAKRAGVRMVYTMHNLAQHEGRDAELNLRANHLMLAAADVVHVHDAATAAMLAQRGVPDRKIMLIPHPSYVGYYPNDVSRTQARQALGLDAEQFVYLFLGAVRPYKGLEELVTAFKALNQQAQGHSAEGSPLPTADCQLSTPSSVIRHPSSLLIAGQVHDAEYAGRIQAMTEGQGDIHLRLSYVPDEQVQVYLNAADVSVFPYHHVTTSGAALMALSFGCPIVAPAIGPFPELVGHHERGVLYSPGQLVEALRAAQTHNLPALRAAAHTFVAAHDWPAMAQRHLVVYQVLVKRMKDEG